MSGSVSTVAYKPSVEVLQKKLEESMQKVYDENLSINEKGQVVDNRSVLNLGRYFGSSLTSYQKEIDDFKKQIDETKTARYSLKSPFSFMKGIIVNLASYVAHFFQTLCPCIFGQPESAPDHKIVKKA